MNSLSPLVKSNGDYDHPDLALPAFPHFFIEHIKYSKCHIELEK